MLSCWLLFRASELVLCRGAPVVVVGWMIFCMISWAGSRAGQAGSLTQIAEGGSRTRVKTRARARMSAWSGGQESGKLIESWWKAGKPAANATRKPAESPPES